MKRAFFYLLLLALPACAIASDAVYLKSGKIIRGRITEESGETITLEGDTEWQDIKRADIKKIVRGTAQPQAPQANQAQQQPAQAYPAQPAYQAQGQTPAYQQQYHPAQAAAQNPSEKTNIGILRIGLDLPGTLTSTMGSASSDSDVNSGFSVGAETISGKKNFGIGLGLRFSMARGFKDDSSGKATISYLTIPWILELSNYDKYRNGDMTFYGRLLVGLSIFMPSDEFLGNTKADNPGAFVSVGVGTRKKHGLMTELSFNIHKSSLKNTMEMWYKYPEFSVGYAF